MLILVCKSTFSECIMFLAVSDPDPGSDTAKNMMHSEKVDLHTKINISPPIINRIQQFLVFQKPESLLFHLKTTFWERGC